jgi:Ran GTPase-activating protein (RanGAP) involved in mRNA processing and transport
LSHYASEQLLDMFRTNQLLHTLVLDANKSFEAKDMKHVFNAIRSYSRSLQRLSLCDTIMTSKSTGYLCRVLEESDIPLKQLDLAHCGLLNTPACYLATSLLKNHHLDRLNISSNKLGEEGADRLAEALYVDPAIFVPKSEGLDQETMTADERLRSNFVNHTEVTTYEQLAEQMQTAEEKQEHKTDEHNYTLHKGVEVPGAPLVCVDASYCSLPPPQAKALLRALCSRPTMRIVRMSGNTIGEALEDVIQDIKMSYVVELQLNQCGLMSKGANSLFGILGDTSGTEGLGGNTLGKCLRALYLANNDIHDSSVEPLGAMLAGNDLIEYLDLGFNQLSAEATPRLREISLVTSQSSAERKLCALSVNLIGNRCDAYALDLPGMSRAKGQFRYGVRPAAGDDANEGYSHVPQVSRKHFFLRQAAYTDKLTQSVPGGEDATAFEMNNIRISNVA